MGKILTKMYSIAVREVQMYNIENRAEKVISREKPVPAPKYPSTLLELEQLKEENVSKEYLNKKNNQLDGYLKQVYVTTPQPEPKKTEINPSNRPLPHSRVTADESLYGYSESEEGTTPAGRLSLKQALQLIADHRSDPEKHSNSSIAAQYKLSITLTDDILNHFKMFDCYFQKKVKDSASESKYQKLQQRVEDMNLINVSKTVDEIKDIKKVDFSNQIKGQEIKDKESVNINVDSNSDLPKDDKEKR